MFQFIQKIIWKKCFHRQDAKQEVRITREFLKILDCFLRNREKWLSGADVMKDTKLWSGTVVIRMADSGWLQHWKVAEGRRVFKLKGDAVEQSNRKRCL